MSKSEHTCIITLRLRQDQGEEVEEMEENLLLPLIEEFETAITESEVGEFEGDDFDGTWHQLTFVGPDADELQEVLESVLSLSTLAQDARLVKKYGNIDDPEAEEVELEY